MKNYFITQFTCKSSNADGSLSISRDNRMIDGQLENVFENLLMDTSTPKQNESQFQNVGEVLKNVTTVDYSTTTTTTTMSSLSPTTTSVGISTENLPENVDEMMPADCSSSLEIARGFGYFTASDWSPGSAPNDARLNGRGGWIGGFGDIHYLEVDLGTIHNISAIRLQPHAQWPKNTLNEFRVLYSQDGFHWKQEPEHEENKITSKFNISSSESFNVFTPSLIARFIVIHPVQWTGRPGPALRMELYGCRSTISMNPVMPVVWRGDIVADETWTMGTPYLIYQPIRVLPGVTLTLSPGVEILFGNMLSGIFVEGTLIANGTEDSPITMRAFDIMSYIVVDGFWRGITFIPGGSKRSSLQHVVIQSAAIGIYTSGDTTLMTDLTLKRCYTGMRIEGGEQTRGITDVTSSKFEYNNHALQMFNVTGNVELSNLTFHASRYMAISLFYPITETNKMTNLTLKDINIDNSSYAVSISGYQSLTILLQDLNINNVEYGIFLEFSDAVSVIDTSIKRCTFNQNALYSVFVDFKRYARYSWKKESGNFSIVVDKCQFQNGANGLNYYGPEVLNGPKSSLIVTNNDFRRLLSAMTLRLEEASYFLVGDNNFQENEDRVLDVTYNALDINGEVFSNVISGNVPQKDTVGARYEKLSLIGIFGNINAQMHGMVNFQYNKISNNSFPQILETDLINSRLSFNLFDNLQATCELCVSLDWIPGSGTINASHNWWGFDNIVSSRNRIKDFFTDIDLAAVDVSPILKEPRVRGASWDSESMHLTEGSSFLNGGIVVGNVTFTEKQINDIKKSIFVPKSSRLTIVGGCRFRFAKNTGILAEGGLFLEGSVDNPVVFDSLSQNDSELFKGIRLMYAEGASFKHVAVTRGYGVKCVGCVPTIDALDVTYCSGVGLWIHVVQPEPIVIRNSYFMKNYDGVYLQIQGNQSQQFSLTITDSHFDQNEDTGLKVQAGNLVSNIEINKNSFVNNKAFGMTLNISDGRISLDSNDFNQSVIEGRSIRGTQLGTQININFDWNCQDLQSRNITITNNTFYSATSPLRGVYVNTICLNTTSIWSIASNTFINTYDDNAGEAASLVLTTNPTAIATNWPLAFTITRNTFECVRQNGVAMRLDAFHGEDIVVYGNNIFGCGSPALIAAQYKHHRLAISNNKLVNCGPTVLHSSTSSSNDTSILDFSYNNASRGNGSATLKTTGYDAEIIYNLFENPAASYELWVGDLAPVNATLNWWGTEDFNRILSRVLDGRTDFTRAEATVFPCLLSANYSHVSTAFPDVFQVIDGVVGGSVKGNVSLPALEDGYEVQYPIRIPYGSSLTIPPGTKLKFRNQTGISALGHLSMEGTSDKWIELVPANGTTRWKGVVVGKYRPEYMRVRLSGSTSEDSGRVEVFVEDAWVGVCAEKFDRADGHVVCRELGFADSTTITAVPAGTMKIGLSNVRCSGFELSLLDCEANLGSSNCPAARMAAISCQPQGNRNKRSTVEESDNLPTIFSYVRVVGADVGLQIDDIDGIQLDHALVLSSRGPGIILNPKSPNGVGVFNTLVTEGLDVGMDVQGAGPITITSTNITKNAYTGLNIISMYPDYSVLLSTTSILDNGVRGMYVNALGHVNMSHCFVQRNADLGMSITSPSMSFYKDLIEDHKLRGANLNSTKGLISIENSAFVNNGGTDVDIEMSVPKNTTENTGLVFIKSALVNSTYNSKNDNSNEYAMYVRLTSKSDMVPIVFSDCRVLDAYANGVFIKTGQNHVSVQVTNCKFERVNGTAVHIETMEVSPELNIESNEFNFVGKETVEVEVRS